MYELLQQGMHMCNMKTLSRYHPSAVLGDLKAQELEQWWPSG